MNACAVGIRYFVLATVVGIGASLAAGLAQAQTAGEMAAMPDANQRSIIDSLVATSISNLSSTTDQSGKPKSDPDLQDSRAMANLIRAWFVQDPDHPNEPPRGPNAILYGIKKAAASEPSKTIVDIMSGFVDGSYAKFYTGFYKPESRRIFQQKSDHDQAALFRVHIELEEERRANDRIIKGYEAKDAELKKTMSDMYDNAIILTDGRHVLRKDNGDFMIIHRDPDEGADVQLEFPYTIEAQSLHECKVSRGISNGMQARAACGSPPIRPTAQTPPAPQPEPQQQTAAPSQMPPPADDPIGEGGFITPPTTPAPAAPQPRISPRQQRTASAPHPAAAVPNTPSASFKVLMCVQRDLVDHHAWEHPAFGSKTAAFRRMAIPYIQSVGQQGWEYLILDVYFNRFDVAHPTPAESLVVSLSPTSGRFDPAKPACSSQFAGYWVSVTR